MDRREMIKEGMRSVATLLPMLLGASGALSQLVRKEAKDVPPERPACFPSPSDNAGVQDPQPSSTKEA